jgi:tetratricopeptide (TPR) repeat protein
MDLQPGNWRNIQALGGLYYYSGRYAEAAHAYRQVVFLDPDNWIGQGNLGNALMMTGDFEAAVEPLNTSLKIERDVYYLSALGTIYYYLGDYDRSAKIQRDATELLPAANFAWLNLGDALRFSSQPQLADEAYREAIDRSAELLQTNPNSAFDLYVQAWATASTGDDDGARILLDRALGLTPGDPNVHYYDALMKFRTGDTLAALNALRSAVSMGYPVAMLSADPLFGALHGDGRFEKLIGKNM